VPLEAVHNHPEAEVIIGGAVYRGSAVPAGLARLRVAVDPEIVPKSG
jgi:hypothetical protein